MGSRGSSKLSASPEIPPCGGFAAQNFDSAPRVILSEERSSKSKPVGQTTSSFGSRGAPLRMTRARKHVAIIAIKNGLGICQDHFSMFLRWAQLFRCDCCSFSLPNTCYDTCNYRTDQAGKKVRHACNPQNKSLAQTEFFVTCYLCIYHQIHTMVNKHYRERGRKQIARDLKNAFSESRINKNISATPGKAGKIIIKTL